MDTSHNEPMVAEPAKRGWRRHSPEFKSKVIELARQGSGSVAAVALANGLNANMLRRWVREAELGDGQGRTAQVAPRTEMPMFVPVAVPGGDDGSACAAQAPSPPVRSSCPSVVVEIRRGATTVQASLPLDEHSAAWLREVLG
jgi:transposase-like protein